MPNELCELGTLQVLQHTWWLTATGQGSQQRLYHYQHSREHSPLHLAHHENSTAPIDYRHPPSSADRRVKLDWQNEEPTGRPASCAC